jgi:2-aminoadipate transaminase
MTLERRKRLVELATKYKTVIIEDDPYGELRYRGEVMPTLKSMDTEGVVVYLGSFSKIISPGLRVGWAVADAKIIQKMVIGKQATDVHTPNLSQQIVQRYIADGHLEGHIKDIIADYGDKRNLMVEKIKAYFPEGVTVSEADGGLFLWVTLPEASDTSKLMPTAVQNKVAYVPGSPFYPHGGGHNTMRLNFSNASREEIDSGMHRLGDAIKQYIAQNK